MSPTPETAGLLEVPSLADWWSQVQDDQRNPDGLTADTAGQALQPRLRNTTTCCQGSVSTVRSHTSGCTAASRLIWASLIL